ncbi:hypothetical protein GPECTOR_15g318 [Gonium pectorale]|uniref:Uncharacterized protein n=1 Tax=Gonium pectorale TaxID=33097 RepID=A0A150GLF3_GONPE|nr:hypothetical protein GPECTOR_15g318 [Gonium pectorale]|eukprot:KXZ50634.1 hypothetical protein GPECTOR_15g318 [Gonium pectorale]
MPGAACQSFIPALDAFTHKSSNSSKSSFDRPHELKLSASLRLPHNPPKPAMDTIKETIQKQTADRVQEGITGTQHSSETAATKASHGIQETSQETGHRAEEAGQKAKHGLGIHH